MKKAYQFRREDFKLIMGIYGHAMRCSDERPNLQNSKIVDIMGYDLNGIARGMVLAAYNAVVIGIPLGFVMAGLEKLLK